MLKQIGWCHGASVALLMAMTMVAAGGPRGASSQPSKDGMAIGRPDNTPTTVVENRRGGWDGNGPDLVGSRVELLPQPAEHVGVELSHRKREKGERHERHDKR